MSPGIWRAALAFRTCRLCREPNRCGEKTKACGSTDWIGWKKLFHPEPRQPASNDKWLWLWLFERTLRTFCADTKRWFWQDTRRLLACRGDRRPIQYRRPWPLPGNKRLLAFSCQSSWTLFQWGGPAVVQCCVEVWIQTAQCAGARSRLLRLGSWSVGFFK